MKLIQTLDSQTSYQLILQKRNQKGRTYQSLYATHLKNPEIEKKKLKDCNPRKSKSESLVESELEEEQMLGRNILELTYENELLGDNKIIVRPCPCGCRKYWATTSLNSKKTGIVRVREELKRLIRMDKQDWSELTLMTMSLGKHEVSRKERCTAENFKPKVDPKEILVEGKFSDSETELEGNGLMFKVASSNDLESERVAKSQMNLTRKSPNTNKCMPVLREDHILYQNLPMKETRSENREQMAKAGSLKFVVREEWIQYQRRGVDSELIKCRKRNFESLYHTINVAREIIQNIRDLNLKFTDHLFESLIESLIEMLIELKNSF